MTFGFDTTTEAVLHGVDLTGRRILVTGVSAGLGVETARALAAHGAQVVGTARDLDKAKRALDAVGAQGVELEEIDLADLASVRAGAARLVAKGEPFDVIITNAGVMATPKGVTKDGFETQFGTNHLGHFVLVNRLAPLLKDGGRFVSLSSSGHRFSDVDLDDPGFEHTDYSPFAAYGRSKTANILFAVAFDGRHKGRGVRACAVHPGGILETELARHMGKAELEALVQRLSEQSEALGHPAHRFKTIAQGSATSVWAAVVAASDEIGARYCENCHVSEVLPDDAPLTPTSEGVRAYALDPGHAEALWAKSEAMVGERF